MRTYWPKTYQKRPLTTRLEPKIEFGDCWTWIASRDVHGYGRIGVEGKNRQAYRVLYEEVVGRIPEGLELDHLCRNTACVNPDHLEEVTHQENMKRADWISRKGERHN